jgi:cyanuric acid amidohydrolase
MSGGTEGALSPHWMIFARETVDSPPREAMAIGVAHTPDLASEHLGRREQIAMVAEGVRRAMDDAGIDDPSEAHFVQIKCPLLTAARVQDAAARGHSAVLADTLKSMGLSRGASALGVAVAFGEASLDDIADADVGKRLDRYFGRASTSAGIELLGHEIVLLGMGRKWSGPLAITHAVMQDAIDAASVRRAWDSLPPGRLAAVLAKAEPDPTGQVRGRRHPMLDDSDISATRYARAFVGGVLAGLFGETEIYVSGGAEHQGPPGGGPVAIIVEREIAP